VRRIIPAAVLALVFAGMAVLYATGQRPISDAMLRAVGVIPFDFPFLDTETVMSAVRCTKQGVDVIEGNPCDPLRRPLSYSPLWLVLAKLPVTPAWTVPAGIVVDLAFIASLLLLPAGRSATATGVIVLGLLSSAVLFALERGNNDLVLFTLASTAAFLTCRPPALRWVGYGAALLAGLLKYYPMTLMALATRERPARFAAVALAAAGVVAIFLLTMGDQVSRAIAIVPVGSWFGDMFGSSSLAGGLTQLMSWPEGAATAVRATLTAAAFGIGIVVGLRPATSAALDRLTELERMSLLAGSLLIVSCFFTAQNIGYRATHLVLTLPALTALWQLRAGRLWSLTLVAVIVLLWTQGWRQWFFPIARPGTIGAWVVRESVWWITIPILIAIVTSLLTRSELVQALRSRTRAR
jgi:hypothetical protein